MATAPDPFVGRTFDDMTLDEFLTMRVRQILDVELSRR